jgi:hypothetical protein
MRPAVKRSAVMRRERFGPALALACLTCALLLGSATYGRAERDRPPPAHTGGFSEPLCNACHFQADVNAGAGALTIDGLPREYEAGGAYTLTITLTQEHLAAGGFQMSARFEDGTQAGTLTAAPGDEARVDVTTRADVQYIHHVYAGTQPVAWDTARWQVLWTTPPSGAVVFHVAANAADDDESPMGDMIYATSVRTARGK